MNDFTSNVALLTAIVGEEAAMRLWTHFGSFVELSRASVDELCSFQGVGPSKAQALIAAFDLSSRLNSETHGPAPLLDCPELIAGLLQEEVRQYAVEHMFVILLNVRRRLIRTVRIAQGTLDSITVHPREVYKPAIAASASAVALLHNHPSGDPTPSDADVRVTRDLIRAGQLLRIELLDHVIVGVPTAERRRGYVSLRELGYFYT